MIHSIFWEVAVQCHTGALYYDQFFIIFLFVVSCQSPITNEGSTCGLIALRDHAAMRMAPQVAVVAVACRGVSNLSLYTSSFLTDAVVIGIMTAFLLKPWTIPTIVESHYHGFKVTES